MKANYEKSLSGRFGNLVVNDSIMCLVPYNSITSCSNVTWAYAFSNHQLIDYLFNNLFMPVTKKTLKLRIACPLWWDSANIHIQPVMWRIGLFVLQLARVDRPNPINPHCWSLVKGIHKGLWFGRYSRVMTLSLQSHYASSTHIARTFFKFSKCHHRHYRYCRDCSWYYYCIIFIAITIFSLDPVDP